VSARATESALTPAPSEARESQSALRSGLPDVSAARDPARAALLAARAPLGNMRLNRLVAGAAPNAGTGPAGAVCAGECGQNPCACPPKIATGSGEPLRARERAAFEPLLGPLGTVRIHDDTAGRDLAGALGARAFTVGSDVFLGSSAPRRGEPGHTRLLAHELAHVAQARHAVAAPSKLVSRRDDPSERAAHGFAAAPTRAPRLEAPSAVLQRDEDDSPPPGEHAPLTDTSAIGVEAPPATGELIAFEGVIFSTDREFTRYQLERMIASQGLSSTRSFVDRFTASPESDRTAEERNERHRRELERYGSDVSGVPLGPAEMSDVAHRVAHPERVGRVVGVVNDELRIQEAEAREFLADFQATAEADYREILQRSEQRMHDEARHYGMREPSPPTMTHNVFADRRRRLHDARERRAHARDRERFLRAAAELRRRRDEVRRLERELEARERREAIGRRPTPFGILAPIPRPRTVWEARDVLRARGEYAEARHRLEQEFPALAAFTDDPDRLDRLSGRTADDVNEVLAAEINERLANIERARGYLADGSVSIWNLPEIIAGARRRMRIDRGTVRSRIVEDRLRQAADERASEERIETMLSVFALALGILAIPLSGGASLAVGAVATGIGVALTIEHIQDYRVESTLARTDFSLAQSIAHEEPSLFWLALEIVGTVLDVGFAVHQFRMLSALRRAAIAGEREAANLLAREAGRLGPAGERLVRETEAAAEAAAREVRRTGRSAAAGISHEAIEAENLARRTVTARGHDYIALADGRIVRCSTWCTPLRLGYADVLTEYPHLDDALTALERMGASGADGAPALTARLDAVRRAQRLEQSALESEFRALPRGSAEADDLRYVRYRRFRGGLADFDEWLSMSRGGRGGGPAHQARVRDILRDFPGSRTEEAVGGRAADVFTPGGPNGRDIYHQVGDTNPVRGDPIARERRAIDDLRRAVGPDADIVFYPKDGSAPLRNPDRDPRFRASWAI
jgi:hypothetical protein